MATDIDVDFGQFVNRLEDVIDDLEGEEEIEQEIIQEQKDAEQKLVDALEELKRDQEAFVALTFFRGIDFSAPHAEVHQQVEKAMKPMNGIDNAGELQNELQEIHHAIGNVERALEELQDVYQKSQQDMEHQQHDIENLREIQQVIGKLQQGAQKYSKWAQGDR